MSKEIKKTTVPRLRFPEFKKLGGWKETPLTAFAELSKGKGISKADISPDGKQPCIRYGELYTIYGDVIDEVTSRTNLSPENLILSEGNEVIIPSSGETKEDIAKASCVLRKGIALGGDLNIIKSKQDGRFLSCYVNGALKSKISKIAQGDAVVHLYLSQLEKISFALPELKEQQKIADCLSSLDDLITAQNDKVGTLKKYKEGLLQQLFPEDGETVPSLRFPEFKKSGEWQRLRLGDFIVERSEICNTKLPLYSLTIEDGITPKSVRYERSFLVQNVEDAYKTVHPSDFAYNPMNLRFGAIAMHHKPIKVALSKYYNVFYCTSDVIPEFCEFYFRNERMIKFYDNMSTGSLVEKKRVHFSSFIDFQVYFPKDKKEQQKIAACLSSLDELIVAETEKAIQLKTHKKSLLQQLFPLLDSQGQGVN